MRYVITGKNIDVTEALKEKIISKMEKLEKLFPEDVTANVTFSVVKLDQIIEVTIPLGKRLLRGEARSFDMYSSIDEVVDILEKQRIKYKDRLRSKARKDVSFKEEYVQHFNHTDEHMNQEEEGYKIEKIKRFALKPMDSDEAAMEMELLGHSFFVFRNGETDEVNVVYKRKNGTYGLIEPEF